MPKKSRGIRDWIKKLMKRLLKGKGVELQIGAAVFFVLAVVLYLLLK